VFAFALPWMPRFPPATLAVAQATCATAWPEARLSGVKYQHLVTFSALSVGGSPIPA
jgi:hypothetical protein